MKNRLSIIAFFLSFCSHYAQNAQVYTYDQIYSLDESTNIMRALIKTGDLGHILRAELTPYLDFYINNYSPAYLAFEAEVCANQNPVLVLCCNEQELMVLEPVCNRLMNRYPGLKIIAVNDETLPSIVAMLEIQVLPAFLFIDQCIELGRVEGTVDLEADFEALLSRLGA